MTKRVRARIWLTAAGIASVVTILVVIAVEPSLFTGRREINRHDAEHLPIVGSKPDTVLYMRLDVEDVEKSRIPIVLEKPEPEKVQPPPDKTPPPAPAGGPEDLSDIGDLVGDASTAMPRGESIEPVKIPPRPLQITWPDTRHLEHCLGHQIDVRIQVDEDGRILDVEVQGTSEHPEDCAKAALESARKIVFSPGRINGRPMKMWTEIRIEFRDSD
jgi:TonB family protein